MPTDKRPPQRSPARKAGQGRRAGRGRLDGDARKQLHALQVHQVELEMQNKELRQVREELDVSLSRYTALYESAPVGYLTLDKNGAILGLNQTAATLLGGGHREWRKTRFDSYLAPGFWPAFSGLLASVALTPGVGSCEAEIQRPDGSVVFAQVSATFHPGSDSYLVTLTDGTARRDAFRRMRDAEQLAQKLLCQNRHLNQRMFETLEEDRRRVVQEMHQELGRGFASIYQEIAMMLRNEHRMLPESRAGIRSITASLAEMQNGLRRIMLRLRPTLLDVAGIAECVREFVANWKQQNPGIGCELTLDGNFHGIPDPINMALFRVVQEAMANVAKHAKASRVIVRMSRSDGQINLVIDDNGDGFDTAAVAPGVGLLGMRERIISLDGQFELVSQAGRGLRIEAWLPTGLPPEPVEHTQPRLNA